MGNWEDNNAAENSPASQTLHPHIIARSFTKIGFPIIEG
jgi:hypothetical protein